jgi:6-phosphogluconate dehydrogenase (decarboxylating)
LVQGLFHAGTLGSGWFLALAFNRVVFGLIAAMSGYSYEKQV